MNRHSAPTHYAVGTLVEYLHDELASHERACLAAHLRTCACCRGELSALLDVCARISRWLEATDYDVPVMNLGGGRGPVLGSRRRGMRRLVATAVVVTIGGGASAAQPLSTWVGERLRDWRTRAPQSEPVVSANEQHGERNSASVRFVPAGEYLAVHLTASQAAGSLAIRFDDVVKMSAEVIEGTDEEFVLLPNGLRIVNAETSRSSYHIVIPKRYGSVFLEVGSEARVRYLANGASDDGWHVVRFR